MDIPCPVAISSYLLTTNAVLFISTLSFKFVLVSKCTDNQNFHPCVTTVQQRRPQATNLNTKSHTLANWQESIAIYTADSIAIYTVIV